MFFWLISVFKLNFFDIFNQSKNRYLKLSQYLKENNYEFADTVRNKGECCIRGQIIDIFSPIENKPIRILYNLDKLTHHNFHILNIFQHNNHFQKISYYLFVIIQLLFLIYLFFNPEFIYLIPEFLENYNS